MIDAQGIYLIQRQIIRDGRSLLQYAGAAFPYAPHQAEPAVQRLVALAREQNAAVGRLVRFLQRHHATPPLLGSFPSEFTAINFVALVHLMPPLQKDEQQGIAELERRWRRCLLARSTTCSAITCKRSGGRWRRCRKSPGSTPRRSARSRA